MSDPQSLSQRDFSGHSNQNLSSVYRLILAAERSALDSVQSATTQAQKKLANQNVIDSRVLGHLLCHLCEQTPRKLFGDTALGRVVTEVISTGNQGLLSDNIVFKLGKRYRQYLLRPFRGTTGPTPQPSNHLSRPSFDTLQDMMRDCMEGSPFSHQTARKRALLRDSYRCLVTGSFDYKSFKKIAASDPSIRDQVKGTAKTYCCHILGEATMKNTAPAEDTTEEQPGRDYAATVMAILNMFGLKFLTSRFLESGGIHDLRNILTMRGEYHDLFDTLNMWFEPTEINNEYNIRFATDHLQYTYDKDVLKPVRFKVNPDLSGVATSDDLPLPDPRLLALHAACAKVAHLSGAAGYFDEVDRDRDEGTVLANDGSSAPLLEDLLSDYIPRAISQDPLAGLAAA